MSVSMEITVGRCVHLDRATEFICTERKANQNYPCPYKGNEGKCKCYIPITREMAEQWKSKGYMQIPTRETKGDERLCFTKYDSS